MVTYCDPVKTPTLKFVKSEVYHDETSKNMSQKTIRMYP